MEKFYAIGEAAKMAGTTIETLRHYDRIGLLKAARVDRQSRYRYYTDTELIYLEVILFCRRIKMSLAEIKKMLYGNFEEVGAFLQSAEGKVESEIQRLFRTKEQVSSLRQSLQRHLLDKTPCACAQPKFIAQRAILLAKRLHEANVENFRRLHSDIYQSLEAAEREKFTFDNSANLLLDPERGMRETMFAVCENYCPHPALQYLAAGQYLCRACAKEDKEEAVWDLWRTVKEKYHIHAQYAILNVRFTGLFQWQYEVQIPLF